jgi:hypothetical protein
MHPIVAFLIGVWGGGIIVCLAFHLIIPRSLFGRGIIFVIGNSIFWPLNFLHIFCRVRVYISRAHTKIQELESVEE